ncbi:MAG: hypothetical protein ACKVOO_03195 [Burkholderiaceae bacterium]
MVFALQVTRSGNLAGSGGGGGTSGSVIERLAFDPWGKRRFPNGMADSSDSIVGLTLDRGYTLHEH